MFSDAPYPLQSACVIIHTLTHSLGIHLCRDVRLLILEHSRWSVIQKYEAVMKGLTVDDLMAFAGELKAELYAEGLVQGNFTSVVRHTDTMFVLTFQTSGHM